MSTIKLSPEAFLAAVFPSEMLNPEEAILVARPRQDLVPAAGLEHAIAHVAHRIGLDLLHLHRHPPAANAPARDGPVPHLGAAV